MRITLPRSTPVSVDVQADQDAWLEIEEAGVELDVSTTAGARPTEVTVPPRYGWFFLPIGAKQRVALRRSQPSASPSAAMATLHCDPSPDERSRIAWYERAAIVSSRMMPNPTGEPLASLLAQIDRLGRDAADARRRALVDHLRAQAYYSNGRMSESTQAFARAELEWLAIGDPSRALAARVGRVEDLIRAGRYAAAQRLATVAFRVAETDGYFLTRLDGSRCLVARYLGDLARARTCYEGTIAKLQAVDERIETSSMLVDLSAVQQDLGQRAAAEHQAQQALQSAEGPYAPIVRGRARLQLALLRLDKGDVASALGEFDAALTEFGSIHASRWEANTMLSAASLYAELGALDEAHAFIEAARALLSEKDAPARIAVSWMILAKTDLRAERFADALDAARTAATRYSALGMPTQLDASRALMARALMSLGEMDEAESLIADGDARHSVDASQWMLISARADLARGRLRQVQQVIARLRARKLSLPEQVELTELDSMRFAASGDRIHARGLLRQTAERIASLAGATRNPVLSGLLIHLIGPLRSLAIQMLLEDTRGKEAGNTRPGGSDVVEEAWQWVQLMNPPPSRHDLSQPPGIGAERFDELLAGALLDRTSLTDSGPRPAITRELLSVLAKTTSGTNAQRTAPRGLQTIREFQTRLAGETAFITVLDARTRGALLWVTSKKASLVAVAPLHEIRESTDHLTRLIATPESSTTAIAVAAESLSAQLFSSLPSQTQPNTLLVEAASDLGSIPWPVMRWPHSALDLIEGTIISLIRPQIDCCGARGRRPRAALHVYVAAQAGSSSPLPGLPTAAIEAKLIALALASSQVPLSTQPANDRGAILDTLRRPGDWVHLAAHGDSQSNGIGYSGIWLDPSPGSAKASFLSAIDVLDAGVGSDLVVLDACKLGERANDGVRPRFSFADAVSRAGARNVVAALWPISDSAAGEWVTEFYQSLSGNDLDDIAGALRKTQLKLRATRPFRHPYFWASWIHIEAL